MFRIDSAGHQGNTFVEKNPAQGIPGTTVSAEWLNAVQEELLSILVAANIDPEKAEFDQVLKSIRVLKADFNTLSDAVGSSIIKDGDLIRVKEREVGNFGGAEWLAVPVATVTPNTYNIVSSSGNPSLALVLQSKGAVDARAMGALGDNSFNNSPIIEAADGKFSTLLFPSPDGEVYRFGTTPTLSSKITCIFDTASAISNRTLAQVNGVVITKGSISGHVRCDELKDKQIEVVCGTLRQNSSDPTKWDFIKDANHEPVGVNDAVQAVANGSELTVNFSKAYSRVLSLVCGPDESLANSLGISVGASVGLNNFVIKASAKLEVSAEIHYQGSGIWSISNYGNVDVTAVSHNDGTGVTTIQHNACPALSGISATPWDRNGALGLTPYLPVLSSTTRSFAASYETLIKHLDISTGNFVLTKNDPMSFVFNKQYSGGLFLDGSNGFDTVGVDSGNIWFVGIMEL